MPKKMLILRGKPGSGADENGDAHEYKTGGLHEKAAKDYAAKKLYEGIVLDGSGTGPGSAQTSQALIMLRAKDKDKDGDDFEALYGFSAGGYNVRWILTALKEDERKRFKLIVVLGAPPTAPKVGKDGKTNFEYDSKGTPQKSAFEKNSFPGGNWELVYQAFLPLSVKTPKKADGHMFLPDWLNDQTPKP